MLVVQEQLRLFILGKLLPQTLLTIVERMMRKTNGLALTVEAQKENIENKPLQLVTLKLLMFLDYMICTAMLMSGAKMTGMIIMRAHLMMVVHGSQAIHMLQKMPQKILQKYSGAAPGTPILGGVALRSAASITRSRRTATLLVFVL